MLNRTSYSRPAKVRWVFPGVPVGMHWAQMIPSRSVRHLYARREEILRRNGITVHSHLLDERVYRDWHAYYREKMVSQQKDVLASDHWFETNKTSFKHIWILDFMESVNSKRVGAAIASLSYDNVMTQHFKASDRLDLGGHSNVSLGTLIEVCYLSFAHAHQPAPQMVSSGVSRNAFGSLNTIGYLLSKLKTGYLPQVAQRTIISGSRGEAVSRFNKIRLVLSRLKVECFRRVSDCLFSFGELPRSGENEPTAWFITMDRELLLLLYPSCQYFDNELFTYLDRLNIRYIVLQGPEY